MRDYDPVTGRYIQADPLGLVDGPDLYSYARQNPMRYSDPSGEYAIPVVVGAVVGAGVGYYETGCWQGALAGAVVGGLGGGVSRALIVLGVNTVATGGFVGAVASAGSQVANNALAGICGCNGTRKSLNDLLTDRNFQLNTILGGYGGAMGGAIGNSSSVVTAWAGTTILRRVVQQGISSVVTISPTTGLPIIFGDGSN